MLRVTQPYSELVEEALTVLGPRLARRLSHVDFFCGVDPVWGGLHAFLSTHDGRSYRDTAHYSHECHSSDQSCTVVLPDLRDVEPWHVVHELGHALHLAYAPEHVARPVSDYARTDRFEAFAEHLVARHFYYGDQGVWWHDEATRALIDRLEGVEP